MAKIEHLELLQQGKDIWNQWRKNHPELRPDLIEADLSGQMLRELDLSRARLNGANLSKTDLYGADLSGADLNGADLSEAYPVKANLAGADLSGATLQNTMLVKANLAGTRLNGSDLSEAHFSKACLVRSDLSGATLSATRFNGTDLNGANLNSLDLSQADFKDIELSGPAGWIKIPLPYTIRDLLPRTTLPNPEMSAEEAPETTQKTFNVGKNPQVVLQNIQADISILAWSVPLIQLETPGDLPELSQKGDLLYINGGNAPITLHVPQIERGSLTLQSNFNTIVTTAIQASQIQGNISITDTGSISLKEVSGEVFLSRVSGNVTLEDLDGEARLSRIAGNIQATRVTHLEIDVAGGNVEAEQVQNFFYCGATGGNCIVQESQQATVSVSKIGGNLLLTGIARSLDCTVGGNARLQLAFPAKTSSHVRVGGTLTITLPEQSDLYMNIAANGLIRGEAFGSADLGSFANLKYGNGSAKLDLISSGGLMILGSSRPLQF